MVRLGTNIQHRKIRYAMNKAWRGIAIFQKYDLSCAIVIKRNQCEVYNTKDLSKEDKKILEAEGWKLVGGIWVLKMR